MSLRACVWVVLQKREGWVVVTRKGSCGLGLVWLFDLSHLQTRLDCLGYHHPLQKVDGGDEVVPTTHELRGPDQPLHATTLLAGEPTPKFVGNEQRREQLAARNYARKLAQLSELHGADDDDEGVEPSRGRASSGRRTRRPHLHGNQYGRHGNRHKQAGRGGRANPRHQAAVAVASPRVRQSLQRTQQWQQRRQREVARSQDSIRAFRGRRGKRAK